MLKIKRYLFWIGGILLLSLVSCEEEQSSTITEILANNGKAWRISYLAIEGSVVNANAYAHIRYTFEVTKNDNEVRPTTYVATGVGTRGITTEGDKPNYFSITNQGTWEVAPGNLLIFDSNSPQPSKVSFIEMPKLGDKIFKIKWVVPEEIDKMIPECIMHLESIE